MWLFALLLVFVLTYFYFNLLKRYKYWDERGVAFEKPAFLFGNIPVNILQMGAMQEMVERIYTKFTNHRYVGVYHFSKPTLLIRDLELIKQITTKDVDYFSGHTTLMPSDVDPLWIKNLFQMCVKDGWQDMRNTLSSSLTSGKMETMFELIKPCAKQFIEFLKNQDHPHSLEAKDLFTRFVNDVNSTCAFGITDDSLKNRNNEFFETGRRAIDIEGFKILKFLGFSFNPTLMKLFGFKVFNKKVIAYFKTIIKGSIDHRRAKNIIQPDLIHLMLEENGTKNTSIESMVAQALIFLTAGFESVSSAMAFLSYDLALNVDVQRKVYNEIREVLGDDKEITYESLLRMKYLDCVVSESLRLHCPTPIIDRKCIKSYTINPVLPTENLVHLEKGTVVWIPILGLHNDEKYYPNPHEFNPERFTSDNKSNIVPYSYLPFGTGPKACLGSKFALLEIKLIFAELLRNFKIMVNLRTEVPKVMGKVNYNGRIDDGLILTINHRL